MGPGLMGWRDFLRDQAAPGPSSFKLRLLERQVKPLLGGL
jgi:hypothetical protein